jgi:hypothetical protein
MKLKDLPFTPLPDGRAALLHPADLSFHELNATGASVVAGLRSGWEVSEVVARLAADADAPEEEVAEAVAGFLADLAALGFPIS